MKSRNGLVQTWHWGTVRRGGAPSCARASSSSRSFVSQRFFRSAPERRSSTRLRFLRSASEMPASSLPTFFSSATECSRMCLSVVGDIFTSFCASLPTGPEALCLDLFPQSNAPNPLEIGCPYVSRLLFRPRYHDEK